MTTTLGWLPLGLTLIAAGLLVLVFGRAMERRADGRAFLGR